MEQQQLLQQMMEQQAAANPQLQTMLALMQHLQDNKTEQASPVEQELGACKAKLAKAITRIRALSAEVQELQEEISVRDNLEDDLALALGACTFCWGEDNSCRACRGRGKPGAFEPDPVLFEKFAMPAFRRSKANLQ